MGEFKNKTKRKQYLTLEVRVAKVLSPPHYDRSGVSLLLYQLLYMLFLPTQNVQQIVHTGA